MEDHSEAPSSDPSVRDGKYPGDADLDIEPYLEKPEDDNPDMKGNGGVLGDLVARTLSRSTTRDLGPPPDGGWTAWLQGMCHASLLNLTLGSDIV